MEIKHKIGTHKIGNFEYTIETGDGFIQVKKNQKALAKLTKFHKKLPDRCYFKELQKEEMKQKHLIEQRKKLNFNIF